jgi:hypothetical protein
MSSGPGPDEPTRVQDGSRRPRERPSGDRARRAAGGIGAAWRNLTADQRLAAAAAIALLLSMLLPWYQETGVAVVRGRPVSLDDSKNAFQVYSFVEAAVFVVSAGVLALMYARGQRKAFHLPGGDGTVIMAAGLWVMFLIFYRQLDKPEGRREGPISTSVGVEWGIFIAFLLGALLAYAGYRIRAAHTPEPPADDGPPPPEAPAGPAAPAARPPAPRERDAPGSREPDATAPQPPREPGVPPDDERTTVAEPPRRDPPGDDPFEGQLSFDEPAEYRPPPRRS